MSVQLTLSLAAWVLAAAIVFIEMTKGYWERPNWFDQLFGLVVTILFGFGFAIGMATIKLYEILSNCAYKRHPVVGASIAIMIVPIIAVGFLFGGYVFWHVGNFFLLPLTYFL